MRDWSALPGTSSSHHPRVPFAVTLLMLDTSQQLKSVSDEELERVALVKGVMPATATRCSGAVFYPSGVFKLRTPLRPHAIDSRSYAFKGIFWKTGVRRDTHTQCKNKNNGIFQIDVDPDGII